MDKQINIKFRASLKKNKFNPTGWKLVMVGSVFTAVCKRFDVTLAEAVFVRNYMRTEHNTATAGCTAHINTNDHFGAVINWIH